MFLAIGTVTGALVAAWNYTTSVVLVRCGAGGIGLIAALVSPDATVYMTLIGTGFSAMMLVTQSSSAVRARTSGELRGRVSAIFSICLLIGVPIEAPLLGGLADWLDDPRPACALMGASVLACVLVAVGDLQSPPVRGITGLCEAVMERACQGSTVG